MDALVLALGGDDDGQPSRDLEQRRDALTTQRQQLTRDNQLRHRDRHFATRVLDVIDTLDFDQKQTLLRLVVEEVHVTGWHVQIRLRIPLDDNPDGPPRPPNPDPGPDRPGPVSTEDRLRSLGSDQAAVPSQDRGRGDQAMPAQHPRAGVGSVRRTGPGRPSPGEASGWFCGVWRLRGVGRAVRCPWTATRG